MKWYKRDPNAALVGMQALPDDEYRAYGVLIDLYYACAPRPLTDELWQAALKRRPQYWRRVRASLIAKDKIRIDERGHLHPNRGEREVKTASKLIAKLEQNGAVSELRSNEIKVLQAQLRNRSWGENQNHIVDSFLLRRERGIRG